MTELVGILNLTPDSFSADGMLAPRQALARIDAMIEEGAAVIDIGAESTRPGAVTLTPEEEWRRLLPVVQALGARVSAVSFSIDTRHAEVARRALAHGFRWINDVSGGADPEMFALAGQAACTLVVMHSLSIPADPMLNIAKEINPVEEVKSWEQEVITRCTQAGVAPANIILDPGIGFGKTPGQSLALIRGIAQMRMPGVRFLVGHSRKSFLSQFTDKPSSQRDPETLAVSCYLVAQHVDYLRVHDIKGHAAMLRIMTALRAGKGV